MGFELGRRRFGDFNKAEPISKLVIKIDSVVLVTSNDVNGILVEFHNWSDQKDNQYQYHHGSQENESRLIVRSISVTWYVDLIGIEHF